MPEAEFEGDLVSGGFEKFKGITVEIQNDFLERLIELVCFAFESLGFAVSIIPDEDVVISVKVERN
jgi:hypothetical protein